MTTTSRNCKQCGTRLPKLASPRRSVCDRCEADARWSARRQAARPAFDAEAAVADMFARVIAQEERRRAALHEAGHAYVLWRLGLGLDSVSVDDHGRGDTTRTGDTAELDDSIAALVLLAGGAAERLAYRDADGCDDDEQQLADILRGRKHMETQLRLHADELVREGRAAVTALADVLEQRRRLDRDTAHAILEEFDTRTTAGGDGLCNCLACEVNGGVHVPADPGERSAEAGTGAVYRLHVDGARPPIGSRAGQANARVVGYDEQGRVLLDPAECRAFYGVDDHVTRTFDWTGTLR